jgi:hypothetical protein
MRALALAVILLTSGSGTALAAHSPFAGTWKLDLAKSKLTGDTLTYSKIPGGLRYSNGSTVAYDITMDGKDHPTMFDRTAAWSNDGKNAWTTVTKAHGVVMSRTHRSLSADGKTLTATYVESRPDGSTVRESDTFTRTSGGAGLVGTWKNTGAKPASFVMNISVPASGRFEIAYPADKTSVSGKTDGSAAPFTGPTAPPGATSHVKAAGPRRWMIDGTAKGKTYFTGDITVSADGKTLTRTTWVPGKALEKTVEVFDRA